MKTCTRCKVSKDDDNFYLINRPAPRKPTLYRHCKACCKETAQENKEYVKNWELAKKYGISLEEYRKQCSIRSNKCDICHTTVDTLHVDHNHSTGKVRGYLCGPCNRAIGLLKDSYNICYLAGNYLKEHNENSCYT